MNPSHLFDAEPQHLSPGAVSFTDAADWRERRSRLTPQERALYREILLAFARGEPPAPAGLAGEFGADLDRALDRLEQLDLVQLDATTGAVAADRCRRPARRRGTLVAPETVVFVGGREGEQSVADRCCPVVNVFASAETASRYREAEPDLVGAIVAVPDVLAGGRAIFAEALQ